MKFKKIYVFCPNDFVSGGPDALHQLVYYLKSLGCDAEMVYFAFSDRHNFAIPDAYSKYISHFITEREFVDDAENAPVAELGSRIEHDGHFPNGTNVEFAQIISDSEIRMRVWERGSGITKACGTGACATAAAAVSKRFCTMGEPISVKLDGGLLHITVLPGYRIIMSGSAETVYEGETVQC